MSFQSVAAAAGGLFGPVGSIAGGAAGALADAAGGGAAGPSAARQDGAVSGMFDSSNWNVTFSGNSAVSAASSSGNPPGNGIAASAKGITAGPMVWIAVAAIVGFLAWKKYK